MDVKQLIAVVKGKRLQGNDHAVVRSLLIDSRKPFAANGTLFIAIKGKRNNGHHYLTSLYEQGVRLFLCSQSIDLSLVPDATVIQVVDTLEALQAIAAHCRKQSKARVIGITGSNGKTVVKEWLAQLLEGDMQLIRSPKSYNSQVRVPLAVWPLRPQHELAIFEAGISQVGEMERLERIIRPDIGLITNVYDAHLENFSSRTELAEEKLKLFRHCKELLYCRDHELIHKGLQKEEYSQLKKWSWSRKVAADLAISHVEQGDGETTMKGKFGQLTMQVSIPFTDEAAIENAIHCWLMLLCMGYDAEVIKARMARLTPVAMRLELKQGIHRSMLVNDTYSADLPSLNIALDFLSHQAGKQKILILSDIYQSGKSDAQLYKEIASMVETKGVDQLIAIGERIGAHQELFSGNATFYSDVAHFMTSFNPIAYRESAILIKGARDFAFERITARLQEKAHETVLEVNLDALVHNLNYFKSLVEPTTKMMVMVKASSYGAGSFEIANTLQYNRVDYLAVAYADEGIQLRERNITVPIMVLNPESTAYDAMIRYQLEPEVYNFRTLHLFCEALKRSEFANTSGMPFPVHIKLDTGMRRLGFEQQEIPQLIETIKKYEEVIRIVSVFSHLTSSGDEREDEHSYRQIELFETMSNQLGLVLPYKVDRHILNTGGIMRFPEAQYEIVRLGIGLYGLATSPHQQQLRAVSRMKTVVSQLKQIEPGDTVGYGRSYKATKKRTIATIPVGYADGLNRKLGQGQWKVRINGVSASIIGDICMDMCMVDVTGITVEEGDLVTIFESADDLKAMAAALDTIPYEIFTNISARVKRVFYHE